MYGSDSGIEMVVATVVFFIGFHMYIIFTFCRFLHSLYIVHSIVRVQVQINHCLLTDRQTLKHPRNMELRNADRFKSALVAALQLASGDKSMGDDFKVPSPA